MKSDIEEKRSKFKTLHEKGCFVLPNPWDTGSAILLEAMGFQALASSSSAHAWTQGKPDFAAELATVLEHLRTLVASTKVPINADFANGYASKPDDIANNVRQAIASGVAGLSIEDSSGDLQRPLRELDHALDCIRAARQAIDESGTEVLLVGRAENFLYGKPDLDDTIKRLQAYAQAGADCLYAPGLSTPEQVAAIVKDVAPKPVNVLVGGCGGFTVAQLADLGVRRISIGGGLARVGWGAVQRAAQTLFTHGRFDDFQGAASYADLNALFEKRQK